MHRSSDGGAHALAVTRESSDATQYPGLGHRRYPPGHSSPTPHRTQSSPAPNAQLRCPGSVASRHTGPGGVYPTHDAVTNVPYPSSECACSPGADALVCRRREAAAAPVGRDARAALPAPGHARGHADTPPSTTPAPAPATRSDPALRADAHAASPATNSVCPASTQSSTAVPAARARHVELTCSIHSAGTMGGLATHSAR